MIQNIIIPKLGQTMDEATIEKWHKQEGDTVEKGDVILEITTDKATLEVESFVSGTVRKIIAEPGIALPVNTVIALVGEPDDPMPENLAALEVAARGEGVAPVAAKAIAQAAPTASAAPPGRIFISPRARRLAEKEKTPLVVLRGSGPNGRVVEKDVTAYLAKRNQVKVTPTAKALAMTLGVDVTLIKGTGPSGRITRKDVLAAPAAAPTAGERIELTAMRRVVAERMSQSTREAPHFYIFMDIDMTAAVAMRKQINEEGPVRVGFHDLLIAACGRGLAEHPAMNMAWDNGALRRRTEANVGLAVAIDDGLMVPVVKNADRMSLRQIAETSKSLIDKTRSKRLTPDEYEGGCLTISNLGMFEVDCFIPIINPGESAILGVGSIAEKPVVIDGAIHVRSIMTATLSADHRIVDGAIAAAFLKAVKDILEDPEQLG